SSAQSFLPASSPVEIRHFEAEDEASAWEWLGARPLAPR
ncbi:MAG: STAS/SEC14 domain-containing protein, partial [Mesorhizobium sp.]